MTSQPESAEVLVRVAPRMLNDVLCVALRQHGLAVYACPTVERRRVPREPRRFDVAVVTEPLPADASAETVIRIDETGEPVARNEVPIRPCPAEQGLQRLMSELRQRSGDAQEVCETP